MSSGRHIRLARLFHRDSCRSIIVPMDHGATLGPMVGLADLRAATQRMMVEPGLVQGLVLHRGALRHLDSLPTRNLPPRILHVSGGTVLDPSGPTKSQVAQVEDALQMGADAVSVHVNLGVDGESAMLRDFGAVASACERWGMPLLAMMYVRPKGVNSTRVADVRLAARVAAEMGADIVKVSHPGSAEAMREVVDGCFVPVLVAGGDLSGTAADVLAAARTAIDGGSAGLCIGRNAFQAPSPSERLRELAEVVHGHQHAANKLSAPTSAPPVHDVATVD
ncbi:MAG: 2-amino-3,7-dideoxy-D-threo-hept-6-ulosonate synthase [Burkholderiaceae bacterium]